MGISPKKKKKKRKPNKDWAYGPVRGRNSPPPPFSLFRLNLFPIAPSPTRTAAALPFSLSPSSSLSRFPSLSFIFPLILSLILSHFLFSSHLKRPWNDPSKQRPIIVHASEQLGQKVSKWLGPAQLNPKRRCWRWWPAHEKVAAKWW